MKHPAINLQIYSIVLEFANLAIILVNRKSHNIRLVILETLNFAARHRKQLHNDVLIDIHSGFSLD
jgi:hypothetical protein